MEQQSPFFESLKPFIKDAWNKAGFSRATAVQNETAPLIVEGKDVIAEAPTGSGKTLAYLLPVLQKIDPEAKQAQVVILASSQELVMQIFDEVRKWTEGSGIKSTSLIGGANVKRQLEKLKKKPHIIVGTPGRVNELIEKKKLKMHEVKTIVLDEGDQLLVPEHMKTIRSIIKPTLKERQLLVFSATLSETAVEDARSLMQEPEVLKVEDKETEQPEVDHYYIVSEGRKKADTLRKLVYLKGFKGLAFMRDIGNLTVFAEKLDYRGVDVGTLHGDTKKQQRAQVLKKFRRNEYRLVLATDVAARGIDLPDINYIINVDPPKETEYTHRAGRTGRLGSSEGTVITIVTPDEEKKMKKLAKDLNLNIKKTDIYKGQLK
ncbi:MULTISPECIES: DEAD/DEAH box helicase [Pontibacillus]|uniref:DEAD/DEAH box helicase n=1 Tax=Pontibacillus chungwhensis TaxID=265426 RepID=A0ABY8V2B0_9BACI|nr:MULTISPECIES: DEAD/DEAH box helicase [Pontibacillus]MCD5322290.1 DEAD/DEAH box helicase [Pontibacillus sp. HN14]WIF99583.1 DEAD/DEAH box helicase [Pontibacillus chungwhensis]